MATNASPSTAELAGKIAELEQRLDRLSAADQLGSSTTSGGSDLTVADAVDAAADSADAFPQLQDTVVDLSGAAADLADALRASSDELDARFELADTGLALAQEQLDDAQQQLDDAFGQIGELGTGNAATAQAARDAAAAAAAAATTATNASTAAANAQSAASAASTAAATANQAALDASGLAATKGRVIVQVSAPTGANADPNNLWIDISGSPAKNTPNRYNTATSKWEPVTDQKALDAAAAASTAAAAASTAQQTADAAKTAAGTAQSAANAAQGTADAAQQTAGTAASNAQAAITSAAAAQGTADTAKTNAATAQSAADGANAQALAAAGIANGKGRVIVQVSAPTGANADPVNLWVDVSLDANGKPRNTPNRYVSYSTLNDPTGVVQLASTANSSTERLISGMTLTGLPVGVQVALNVGLYVSMNLPSVPKRSIARVRDGGITGPVVASYAFTDKGDSVAGNAEHWDLGAYVTPTTSTLVVTIQSDNANAPEVYASRRLIAASAATWAPITDQKAVDAATTAAAAQSTANSAATAAATAQSTANTAATNAAAAQTAADTAQGTANTAKTNAATAQSAADGANAQALAAAGIANGKGKLIVQVSAPTGANAVAENLWVDISGTPPKNQPNRWNPTTSKWEPVTDQKVVDAATAAATANTAAGNAKTVADNAATAASTAQQAANAAAAAAAAAQATATGRPQILFGTGTPVGTAPQGSTWFQVDANGSVIGQWQQTDASVTGSTWTARQLRSEVIANLDVGKLTVGTAVIVDAVVQQIAAQTANIQTANIANLFVTSGATMKSATIEALFTQVVKAHQITADMIDVGTLNGITLTGTIVQTAATGQRAVLSGSGIKFYDGTNQPSGQINGWVNGASGGLIQISPGLDTDALYIGTYYLPVGGTAAVYSATAYHPTLYVDQMLNASTGERFQGTYIGTRSQAVGNGAIAGIGLFTMQAGSSQSFITMDGSGRFTLAPGAYMISVIMTLTGAKATGRTFVEFIDVNDGTLQMPRGNMVPNVGEDTVSTAGAVNVSSPRLFRVQTFQTSGGSQSVKFTLGVTKVG